MTIIKEKPYLQTIIYQKEIIDAGLMEDHPYNLPVLKNFKRLDFHEDVTFLVGENGTGKSTLIEAIALGLGFSAEGGTKNFNLTTTEKSASPLHRALKLIRSYKTPRDHYFLRAESFYNVSTYMDEVRYLDSYGGKSLH